MALGLYQTTVWGYANVSLVEFRYLLLGDWIKERDNVRECGGATWSSLVNALRDEEVNQNGIADKIEAEKIRGHQEGAGNYHWEGNCSVCLGGGILRSGGSFSGFKGSVYEKYVLHYSTQCSLSVA